MDVYLVRPGNSPTQIRETAAAIQAAIVGMPLPARLTFGRLAQLTGIKPHLMSACLKVAAEKVTAVVGHPVRMEGEKAQRRVVVG